MSKITLNSITSNISTPDDAPMNYIGALVESESGYLVPKLFRSATQFDTILGEFKYSQLYKSLLSYNIQSCLLPVLTKASKYNRCSLRLTNSKTTPVSHPKYGTDYRNKFINDESLDSSTKSKMIKSLEDSYTKLDEGHRYYGVILDFTSPEISRNDLIKGSDTLDQDSVFDANYLILNTGYISGEFDSWDQIICTNYNIDVSSSDYNIDDSGAKNTYIRFKDDLTISSPTKSELVYNLRTVWNLPEHTKHTNSRCYYVSDLLLDYFESFLLKYQLPITELSDIDLDDWKVKLIDESYVLDPYICTNKQFAWYLTKIIEDLLGTLDINSVYLAKGDNFKSYYTEVINNVCTKYPLDKLLIRFNYPVTDLNRNHLPGLKIEYLSTITQDYISSYTEDIKVIDIYSKIKGPVGKNISVTINTYTEEFDLYELRVSNGLIDEYYIVRLAEASPSDLINSTYISDVSKQSQLIDIVIYNYWGGDQISTTPTNANYLTNDTDIIDNWFESNVRDVSELKLPIGTFKLDRSIPEDIQYEDYIDSLELYRTSGWYPDYFIVPEIPHDPSPDWTLSKSYLSKIQQLVDIPAYLGDDPFIDLSTESIYSQAIINVSDIQLNTDWYASMAKYTQLPSENNRLIYTFGELSIDNMPYPALYPYIISLITGEYLTFDAGNILYYIDQYKPNQSIIIVEDMKSLNNRFVVHIDDVTEYKENYLLLKFSYQTMKSDPMHNYLLVNTKDGSIAAVQSYLIDSLDEVFDQLDFKYLRYPMDKFLDKYKINYLKYNGLEYYWENILEPIDQPSNYILRSISSKYTRELYKVKDMLRGVTPIRINDILNNLNTRCMRNFKGMVSSTYSVLYNTVDPNLMKVQFDVVVVELVNKKFQLDIILNIK